MARKNSRKNQKLYKMKGCSKTQKYLGGSKSNIILAYPSNNVPTTPNPFLAYTGKGGSSHNLAYPQNTNGSNPIYPSTGPISTGFNFLNSQGSQKGGSCGCSAMKHMGGACSSCTLGFLKGGSHRVGCKCSKCKMNMNGGSGNNGIPYPNGLVGSAWKPSSDTWPGVNGVNGDSNHLALNKYPTDVQTSIINTGANRPFSIGGRKNKSRRKGQNGGTLSNFLAQDFINLGRQFQFGLGSAYNAISGYASPTNPLPWKGQFPNNSNITALKAVVA